MFNSTLRFEKRAAAWLDSLRVALETLAEWMERHPWAVISAFSIAYFPVTFEVAQRKLFWFDELFTYYLATLPSVGDIVSELAKGVDHHPLSYFLLLRGAAQLWPDPHIAFRIPSIIAFWLLSVCLFRFVARRTSVVYGTLAMLAPCMTGAKQWITDARPYGPAVGLLAAAYVAWQSATMPVRRWSSLVLMAVALAGSVSMSYYAVLAFVPLGLAELARTIERRRIDLPMWLSIGAGASVGLLYLPSVGHSIGQFSPDNWARPGLGSLFAIYQEFFGVTMLFWLGCLLFVTPLLMLWRSVAKPNGEPAFGLPAAEIVLAIGLLLLPALGVAVAFTVTKMITARYVIGTVIGFAILLSFLASRASRAGAAIALAIVSVALFSTLANWLYEWRDAGRAHSDIETISALLETNREGTNDLPIVFENPLRMFELAHYSGPSLAGRLVFLSDPEASRSYSGVQYVGSGMTSLQAYAPVHVEAFADFRRDHPRFLLYEVPFVARYVLPKLVDEGAHLQLLGLRGADALYLVD